jgi:tetratricopeptide (TPR) repeat protein
MRYLGCAVIALLAVTSFANDTSTPLPHCGTLASSRNANATDATPRVCPTPTQRAYKQRYQGIAYDILNEESKACFVPDAQFELLDSLVDEVRGNVSEGHSVDAAYARTVSEIISDSLAKHGFAFYTPIDTLSDMLERRADRLTRKELHVFDCDTSSLLYLTIAQNLSLPVTLVEIAYFHGDSDHVYIRWQLDRGEFIDWDTNGSAECRTPSGQPLGLGRAMSPTEVRGYAKLLSAEEWTRSSHYKSAAESLIQARRLYPSSATAANNFAWLIATKQFTERKGYSREALREAKRAVSLVDKPNHLDTLACAYAFNGDFRHAVETSEEAVRREPNEAYRARLKTLKSGHDCTGSK